MKKIIVGLLLLLFILSIAACDKSEETNNDETHIVTNEDTTTDDTNTDDAQTQELNTDNNEDEGIIKGSLNKLMSLGKSVECEFNYVDSEGTVEQTTYVSKEKFRSDSTMTIDGDNVQVHSISDGTWLYMWSDMTPGQGTKIKFEDFIDDAQEAGQGEYESANLDLEKEYDFKCVPWIPNNAKFTPPSNIDFKDLGEMMDAFQNAANGAQNDMCAVCEMIPDATAKADCLASC